MGNVTRGFPFLPFNFLHQEGKKQNGQGGCQGVDTRKIKPDAVKAEAPKGAKQNNGKDEGRSDRDGGCLQGLLYRAEKALRDNANPAENIGKAEKPDGVGGNRKKPRLLRLDEPGGYRSWEKEEQGR